MKDERIASLMSDALHFRDQKDYRLDAYCIMSNHVHAVFAPLLDNRNLRVDPLSQRLSYISDAPPLGAIMHSIKSYTAQEANNLLARKGTFWEAESYDHAIRDDEEYHRVIHYVLNNPVKAGLVENWRDWRWTWKRGEEEGI
jgi:REP element-mobilizing transposase RayT